MVVVLNQVCCPSFPMGVTKGSFFPERPIAGHSTSIEEPYPPQKRRCVDTNVFSDPSAHSNMGQPRETFGGVNANIAERALSRDCLIRLHRIPNKIYGTRAQTLHTSLLQLRKVRDSHELLSDAVRSSHHWGIERTLGGELTADCLTIMILEDRIQDISVTLWVGPHAGLNLSQIWSSSHRHKAILLARAISADNPRKVISGS